MKISQCMIVKNEEENIRRALSWGKDIVCEQIVVDTGSTDKTVEIAKEMGATVFRVPWKNDFASAKNYALQKAYGDWILFLDADEYFEQEDAKKIPKYLNAIDKMKPAKGKEKGAAAQCTLVNVDLKGNIISVIKQIRIFRNRKYIRYEGKIHENIVDTRNKGLVLVDLTRELTIYHTGYDKEVFQRKKKLDRNVEMIQQVLDENPENANYQLYMAETLSAKGHTTEAMEYVERALKNYDGSLETERMLLAHQMRMFQSININKVKLYEKQQIIKMYEEAVGFKDDYPDFDVAMGFWYHNWGEYGNAVACFVQALEKVEQSENLFGSKVTEFLEDIYRLLVEELFELEQWQGVVAYGTTALQINPYDENVLVKVINVLSDIGRESPKKIVDFMEKLYDFSDKENQKFLVKIGEKLNDSILEKQLEEKLKKFENNPKRG